MKGRALVDLEPSASVSLVRADARPGPYAAIAGGWGGRGEPDTQPEPISQGLESLASSSLLLRPSLHIEGWV